MYSDVSSDGLFQANFLLLFQYIFLGYDVPKCCSGETYLRDKTSFKLFQCNHKRMGGARGANDPPQYFLLKKILGGGQIKKWVRLRGKVMHVC